MWRFINEMTGIFQIKNKKIDEPNGPNINVHNSSDIANVLKFSFQM